MTECKDKDKNNDKDKDIDFITRLLYADADPNAEPDSWFRRSSKTRCDDRVQRQRQSASTKTETL